jgi:multicomponent Na+:H+ antiporter subunit F
MLSEYSLLPIPVFLIVTAPLLAALALTLWRAVQGPSSADRVMALDLMGAILMGACVLLAMLSGRELFLDVALAVAVIAFIGTVAFARQIEAEAKAQTKETNVRTETSPRP